MSSRRLLSLESLGAQSSVLLNNYLNELETIVKQKGGECELSFLGSNIIKRPKGRGSLKKLLEKYPDRFVTETIKNGNETWVRLKQIQMDLHDEEDVQSQSELLNYLNELETIVKQKGGECRTAVLGDIKRQKGWGSLKKLLEKYPDRFVTETKKGTEWVRLKQIQKDLHEEDLIYHPSPLNDNVPADDTYVKTEFVKTAVQSLYWEALNNPEKRLVIAEGPAGTGKTYYACKYALDKIRNEEYERIIVTRPIVPVQNEQLGFLPGSKEDKMEPWLLPIYDLLIECGLLKDKLNSFIDSSKIEIVPLGFMRGRTFHDCVIIADEMQNSSPIQMKMLLTRIGRNTKTIVTGDGEQSDIISSENGLEDLRYRTSTNRRKNMEYIKFCISDTVRDPFVKDILDVYSV